MKKLCVICSAIMLGYTVYSATPFTNSVLKDLFPTNYIFKPLDKPFECYTLGSKFAYRVGTSDTFANNLSVPSDMSWAWNYQHRGYDYLDEVNNAGRRSCEDSFNYGLRETAVSYFPVDQYESDIQDFGAHFFHGIIGNTAEEQQTIISATPSASSISWWKQARKNGYDYGLRPFNSSPYLYGRFPLGSYQGQPWAVVSGRWYYTIRHNSEHIEVQTTFAMPYNYSFQIGVSVDPFRIEAVNGGSSFSLRLQHVVNNTIFDSWWIGFEQNHQSTVVAALSKRF